LGVIGTTILTAIIGKLVSLAFERTANLIVTVSVNQSFKSPILANEVREWRKNSVPQEDWLRTKFGLYDKYDDYFKADKYVRLEVKNNSNKKLQNFTFCAHSVSGAIYQIGDGEIMELAADVPVPLGDLQPKREVTLHILTSSFWAYSVDQIRAALVFSADELGRVKYKFPLPFLFTLRFRYWGGWVIAAASGVFIFGIMTYFKG
jgi:hypothetical protein